MRNIENSCALVRGVIGNDIPRSMKWELQTIESMSGNPRMQHRAWRRLSVLECLAYLAIATPCGPEWCQAEELFKEGVRVRGEWPLLRIGRITPSVTLYSNSRLLSKSIAGKTSLALFMSDVQRAFRIKNKRLAYLWRIGAILTFLTMYREPTS